MRSIQRAARDWETGMTFEPAVTPQPPPASRCRDDKAGLQWVGLPGTGRGGAGKGRAGRGGRGWWQGLEIGRPWYPAVTLSLSPLLIAETTELGYCNFPAFLYSRFPNGDHRTWLTRSRFLRNTDTWEQQREVIVHETEMVIKHKVRQPPPPKERFLQK